MYKRQDQHTTHEKEIIELRLQDTNGIENFVKNFAKMCIRDRFGDMTPLSMIEGAFLKYFGIPVALPWFMSQKTFDGKKPYSFLKSQITYALRPKITRCV